MTDTISVQVPYECMDDGLDLDKLVLLLFDKQTHRWARADAAYDGDDDSESDFSDNSSAVDMSSSASSMSMPSVRVSTMTSDDEYETE